MEKHFTREDSTAHSEDLLSIWSSDGLPSQLFEGRRADYISLTTSPTAKFSIFTTLSSTAKCVIPPKNQSDTPMRHALRPAYSKQNKPFEWKREECGFAHGHHLPQHVCALLCCAVICTTPWSAVHNGSLTRAMISCKDDIKCSD